MNQLKIFKNESFAVKKMEEKVTQENIVSNIKSKGLRVDSYEFVMSKQAWIDFKPWINTLPSAWINAITCRVKGSKTDTEAINIISNAFEKLSTILLLNKKYGEYNNWISSINDIIKKCREYLIKRASASPLDEFLIRIKMNKVKSARNYLCDFKKDMFAKESLMEEFLNNCLIFLCESENIESSISTQFHINKNQRTDIIIDSKNELTVIELKKGHIQRKDFYQLYDYGYLLKEKYSKKKINKVLIGYGFAENMNILAKDLKITAYSYKVKDVYPIQLEYKHNYGSKNQFIESINLFRLFPRNKFYGFIQDYIAMNSVL